ncbi:hypothetical protein, partial [Frederiksenia canicola]
RRCVVRIIEKSETNASKKFKKIKKNRLSMKNNAKRTHSHQQAVSIPLHFVEVLSWEANDTNELTLDVIIFAGCVRRNTSGQFPIKRCKLQNFVRK